METGPEAPPRVGLGLLARAAVAAVIIVLVTAGTVAAVVIRETCQFVGCGDGKQAGIEPLPIPEISPAEAGGARTVLLLGSDERYADKVRGRSDTLLLARIDPKAPAITVMSIPRDLKVAIPGHGRDKVNAAYAEGGERLTVRTLKALFAQPGEEFPITNVVNVNFGGFRRAVDFIGGVYVDVDRSYLNDNDPPTDSPVPYATIDVPAGYQKLSGRDALDYVRYRHTDNDFVRASRQQDFLRQVKSQPGARRLLAVSQRGELGKIFRRYIKVDSSLRDAGEVFAFLKLAIFTRDKPVLQVPFRASESGEYVVASQRQLAATVDDFLHPEVAGSTPGAKARPKAPPRPKRSGRSKRRKGGSSASALPPGTVRDRRSGEDMAIVNGRRAHFPFYFPTVRLDGARYADASAPGSSARVPRVYSVRDQNGRRQRAYRIVVAKDRILGQYYGIQGVSWPDPPILANPSETRSVNGRKLQLYYDGRSLRLAAFQTPKAAYWVSNTLTNSLSNQQMLAIAGSMTRLR